MPNSDMNLVYLCPVKGKLVKRKAARIAWEILHNSSSDGMYVIHRDLDESNLRGSNLVLVPKEEYSKIKDALLNIRGAVRVYKCKSDAFSYIVQFKMQGRTHRHRCEDVVTALRFKKKAILLSLKYVGKYLSTK